MAVVLTASFLILVVAQSRGDIGQVGQYIQGIHDVKVPSTKDDKMVQQLQLLLEAKNEENTLNLQKVQDLDSKVKTALQQVSQLEEKETLLNATVEKLSRENEDLKAQIAVRDTKVQDLSRKLNDSLQKLEEFSDTELHLNNVLNDFYRDKDWRSLRTDLESILSKDSVAYQQLQKISYGHGYPLWKIGSYCYTALAEVLVSGAQGPNISESDGDTILHGASEGGCMELATKLLDMGANVNARDNGGATPLIIASRYGRLPFVKLLRERGGDLHAADSKRMTSLHLAAEGGHLDVVKYLVDAGVDCSVRDIDKLTPLGRAKARGRTSVVQYLSQEMGINTDATTSTPRTPRQMLPPMLPRLALLHPYLQRRQGPGFYF